MAKKKKQQPAKAAPQVQKKPQDQPKNMAKASFWLKTNWQVYLLFIVSFLLYANTLGHQYAVDDSIVIQKNKFTRLGLKGMSGIWGEDTFVGFFGGKRNLVAGGRYRPFTLATFALEMQLFGRPAKDAQGNLLKDEKGQQLYDGNPGISHAINAILYGLLVVVLFLWIMALFDPQIKDKKLLHFLAFAAALLFAAHPLHTEAVANIKGRDEIMVTLGAILAAYWSLKAIDQPKKLFLYGGGAILAFFVALFSKESAIPFIVLIPLSFYFFRKQLGIEKLLIWSFPFLIAAAIFWFGMRNPAIGWDGKTEPAVELMNDPYLKLAPAPDGKTQVYVPFSDSERYGTVLYTWGEYIRLLVLPHPLTNDYYPKHIRGAKNEIPTLTDPWVLLILLFHIGLAVWAFIGLLKRKPYAFALIFYAATFSVVSNLFFPIGTNMAERFMFMPSIGFSLLTALGLLALLRRLPDNKEGVKNYSLGLWSLLFVSALYAYKTIDRNPAWYDDYTLFTTDIEVSPNSAKLNNAVSGVLQEHIQDPKMPAAEKMRILQKAQGHAAKAIELHPSYTNAWLLQGNAFIYMGELKEQQNAAQEALQFFDKAIACFNQVKVYRPDHPDVNNNMTVAHRDKARVLGQRLNKLQEAVNELQKAYTLSNGQDFETLRLMGIAYGIGGQPQLAARYFEEALVVMPNNIAILYNLEAAYNQLAQNGGGAAAQQKAQEYGRRWRAIDPNYDPRKAQ